MKRFDYKKIEPIIFYSLAIVTTFWFFFYINKGIDVTDTAYYLAKYKYYFEPGMELKSLGTFLTDVLGAFIYSLSDTGQVLILSIVHWVLYMGSGLCVYKTLKKYAPRVVLLLAIFIGSLFSLTWIHVMNYNATSMFMQTIAICVLIKGFEKDNRYYLVLAGFLFGINTFFRLPNILQVGIGVSIIWYYGFCKEKWKKSIKYMLYYAMGVVAAGISGLCLAIGVIGIEQIKAYLFSTVSSASDASGSHGIVNILDRVVSGFVYGIKGWIYNVGLWVIVTLLFVVVLKRTQISISQQRVLYICFMGGSIMYGMFVGNCLEYIDFYQMIAVFVIGLAIIGGLINRKSNALVSVISIICVCAESVLCIGTDNAWYYQVVFLIFPLCICVIIVCSCQQRCLRMLLQISSVVIASISCTVGVNFLDN